VPGAVNVPFTSVLAGSDDLRAEASAAAVVYCGHGPRVAGEDGAATAGLRGDFPASHMAGCRRAGLREER
jgi:hypothetical protein